MLENEIQANDVADFKKTRIKTWQNMYSDNISARNIYGQNYVYKTGTTKKTNLDIQDLLDKALKNKNEIVELSQQTYAINPIYSTIVDYLATMFLWRYVVIPHKLKLKQTSAKKFTDIYNLMLEAAEGLNLEKKMPSLLAKLFIEGSVYLTTTKDEESLTVDSVLLPSKYCRKIGETQFGTGRFEFDYSYFDSFGLNNEEKIKLVKTFTPEIEKGYRKYLKDKTNNCWQQLDPRFSSCVLLNEKGIPNLLYSLGAISNYEKYVQNELERNENKLKYIVAHEMPHWEDKLLLEVDEVEAIHSGLAKIINTSEKTRLITTYGKVSIEKVGDSETTENKTLVNAYRSIFNNVGVNDTTFVGESVEALKTSLIRDKAKVWRYVEEVVNFYNIAINNWFDFKNYQADINMLQISPYTLKEDLLAYKENATLGVGKLDFMVAAGIKQKHIQDRFDLEEFLDFSRITPLQTSYTQTDNSRNKDDKKEEEKNDKVVIDSDNNDEDDDGNNNTPTVKNSPAEIDKGIKTEEKSDNEE